MAARRRRNCCSRSCSRSNSRKASRSPGATLQDGASGARRATIQGDAAMAAPASTARARAPTASAVHGRPGRMGAERPSSKTRIRPRPVGAAEGVMPQPASTGRPAWANTISKLGISIAAATSAGKCPDRVGSRWAAISAARRNSLVRRPISERSMARPAASSSSKRAKSPGGAENTMLSPSGEAVANRSALAGSVDRASRSASTTRAAA